MKHTRSSGFTIVEMVLASSVFLIVMAQLFASFLGLQRMLKEIHAEAEMAIAMDQLRERLLFRLDPNVSQRRLPGLLGMTVGNVDSVAVNMNASAESRRGVFGNGLDDVRDASARLMWDNGRVKLDNVPSARKWLDPGGFGLAGTWLDCVSPQNSPQSLAVKPKIYFTLTMQKDGVSRSERIVVPLFGRNQPAPRGTTNVLE